MNSIKFACFVFFLIVFYLQSQAQITDSLRAKYFNSSVAIVTFDQQVYQELSDINELPVFEFYNRAFDFFHQEKPNEAALFFIAGMWRSPLFQFMDSNYVQSSDEADTFISTTHELQQLVLPHLNSNLHNYAAILNQYCDWYSVNMPKKVHSTEGIQTYKQQLEFLKDFAIRLEKNPDEYILAIEDMNNNHDISNEDVYIIVDEDNISNNQSGTIPQSFLVYDYATPIVKNQDFELFAVANSYYNTYLEGENVIIKQHHYNPMIYMANPGNADQFSISVYGEKETGEREILGTYQFRTVDSLTPVVYIDDIRSGNKITSFDSIACTYYSTLYEAGKLQIKYWELVCEKKIVVGTGGQLSLLAKSFIKELEVNTPFIINVVYLDPEAHEKFAKGVFVR
ncbi:MAG: hypothetical protein QE487_11895 [Fluviicola sp.]|nr:hypothetical protein [Fluviicola sp.]